MKKKLTILIASIILVLLVLSTTTYALFFKQDKLENQETYTAGILDIVLENNEEGLGEVLRLANSLPITDEVGKKSKPYKFKITNKGNLSYTFDLKMLSTTTSNQIDSQYIKVMIDDNEPVNLSSLASSIIASNLTLNPGDSKIISVRLWLDEYTPNSQIGKVFSAKIVGDGKGTEYIKPTNKTSSEMLQYLGLTAKVGIPDFSQVATTDEGIYAAEDDYGKSYYFRGASTNNYVKFAGYYFRIIRINGDGSIRMIYDGTVAHSNGESSTDRQIGISVFNNNSINLSEINYREEKYHKKEVVSFITYENNPVIATPMAPTLGLDFNAYVGYMYGTPGSNTYATEHANKTNSNIKTIIDNWYKINIIDAGFGDRIADVIYCNDRELDSGTGVGTTETYYKAFSRIADSNAQLLTCAQQNDAFTVDDTTKGNGALTYPVGLITADEVSMAGGKRGSNNSSYYLYTGSAYWTMSPSYFDNFNYAYEFVVYSTGNLFPDFVSGYLDDDVCNWGVRPVISLRNDVEFTGTGTKDNPFEVKQ